MAEVIELRVNVDCPGCDRKIRRALYSLRGIETISIDREQQKVIVTGYVDRLEVLKKVRKARRNAEFWAEPGELQLPEWPPSNTNTYNGGVLQHDTYTYTGGAFPYTYPYPGEAFPNTANYNNGEALSQTYAGYYGYENQEYTRYSSRSYGSGSGCGGAAVPLAVEALSNENPNHCCIM